MLPKAYPYFYTVGLRCPTCLELEDLWVVVRFTISSYSLESISIAYNPDYGRNP